VDAVQYRQKLLGTEAAQGVAALELGDMQCHWGGLKGGLNGHGAKPADFTRL